MNLIYCADQAIQTGITHKPRHKQDGARIKPSARLRSDKLGDSCCWPDSMGALSYPLSHSNRRCV